MSNALYAEIDELKKRLWLSREAHDIAERDAARCLAALQITERMLRGEAIADALVKEGGGTLREIICAAIGAAKEEGK